jgi:hypothetical protein
MLFLHLSVFCIKKVFPSNSEIFTNPWYELWSETCSVSLICSRHSIDRSDLHELAHKQANIQRLIYENNESKLKTVNTHYLSHLVTMIENFGPLRGFWCFPFESCLKRVCLLRNRCVLYNLFLP